MYDKYLPLGTVVLLKDGKKRLMITGYCIIGETEPNRMYDYCGVIYPEGMLSSKQSLLFNHDQISTIFYKGLDDDEFKAFNSKLKEELSKKIAGTNNEH